MWGTYVPRELSLPPKQQRLVPNERVMVRTWTLPPLFVSWNSALVPSRMIELWTPPPY